MYLKKQTNQKKTTKVNLHTFFETELKEDLVSHSEILRH